MSTAQMETTSSELDSQRADLSKLTTRDQNDLLRWCDKQFEKCKTQRLPFERQWYLNLAFYFGKQWCDWSGNSSLQRLVTPPAPSWRVRLTVNRIRPAIRSEIAKLIKEHPTAFVIPASSDDKDIAAARAGEAIFEHEYRTLKLAKIVRQSAFWTTTTGTGFLKDWWSKADPQRGTLGDICVESPTPFHLMFPDLTELEIENQPFIIHTMTKSPEYVEERFGARLKGDSTAAGSVDEKFLSALGLMDSNRDYVSIKEIWIKPCKRFPNGAVIVWAENTILSMSDNWPFNHGQYPFSKIEHIPTGRFYGDSIINDLIPVQKEYNRTRSQLVEAKNRMSKPQLAAQKGSIDTNKLTSEPGLVVQYLPGFNPPSPIPLTAIPAYVTQELDRCLQDIDDISSQHEISRGEAPPGVSAATAISFLSEQDDSKLASTVGSLEEAVEKVAVHILSHANQFWDSARTVKVVGTNGTYETYQFTKADINGNTDIRVEAGSAMPTSRAAKQAFIMELIDKQIITGPMGLKYLEMNNTGQMYEDLNVDQRQAQRENLKLAEAVEVPVNDWDNIDIHIMEHDLFRKKQEYETLGDDVKQIFNAHVDMHKQVLAMKQQTPIMPGSGELPPGMEGGPPPVGDSLVNGQEDSGSVDNGPMPGLPFNSGGAG